jgi:hypothetical protein
MTPDLAFAFGLSTAGTFFVIFSRDVRAKRIVLPAMLVVSSLMIFLIIERNKALPQFPPIAVVAVLLLNALFVFRIIAYCPACGRTIQRSLLRGTLGPCPSCDGR